MSHTDPEKEMMLQSLSAALADRSVTAELAGRVLEWAEKATARPEAITDDRAAWHEWLRITVEPAYLKALDGPQRQRWAEAAFGLIRYSGYSLLTLLSQRAEAYPDRPLFQEMGPTPLNWTYREISRHIRDIAALFHHDHPSGPRIAFFLENSVEGAACDLACLMYDILCTPLNVHFSPEILISIFDRLGINGVVTDQVHRYEKLLEARKQVTHPFRIYITEAGAAEACGEAVFLGKACKQLQLAGAEKVLEKRTRFTLNQVATVMFTSGSTGKPKGVCFSG